jgi:hypothetical protein
MNIISNAYMNHGDEGKGSCQDVEADRQSSTPERHRPPISPLAKI